MRMKNAEYKVVIANPTCANTRQVKGLHFGLKPSQDGASKLIIIPVFRILFFYFEISIFAEYSIFHVSWRRHHF